MSLKGNRCFLQKVSIGYFAFWGLLAIALQAQTIESELWQLAPKGSKIRGFELPVLSSDGIQSGLIRGREVVIVDRFTAKIVDFTYESTQSAEDHFYLHISEAVYDREKNEVRSDGRVLLRVRDMEISGTGLIWNLSQQKGCLLQEVRVVISQDTFKTNKSEPDV